MKKISYGTVLCAFLLIIHLVPIWYFQYFPSQHGPSHLYNSRVLHDFHSKENLRIHAFYALNLKPFPNSTYTVISFLLLFLFSPLVVEKIIVSILVLFLPLSLLYFQQPLYRTINIFSLAVFIFTFNYFLFLGFYNFLFSVSLYFATLVFCYKNREQLNFRVVILLYLLMSLVFFSHVTSYLLLLCTLVILSGF